MKGIRSGDKCFRTQLRPTAKPNYVWLIKFSNIEFGDSKKQMRGYEDSFGPNTMQIHWVCILLAIDSKLARRVAPLWVHIIEKVITSFCSSKSENFHFFQTFKKVKLDTFKATQNFMLTKHLRLNTTCRIWNSVLWRIEWEAARNLKMIAFSKYQLRSKCSAWRGGRWNKKFKAVSAKLCCICFRLCLPEINWVKQKLVLKKYFSRIKNDNSFLEVKLVW